MIIKIACQGAAALDLSEFTEFQGDLKSLSKADYSALKKQIIEQGFSFTVHVWRDRGYNHILDGHQRLRTVRKMVAEEGWECPSIPVSYVEADSYEQAKKKLLGAASQYGKITSAGLYEFMSDAGIDVDYLEESTRLPEFHLETFKNEYIHEVVYNDPEPEKPLKYKTETVFPELSPGPNLPAPKKEAVGAKEFTPEQFDSFDHQCPRCGFNFDK